MKDGHGTDTGALAGGVETFEGSRTLESLQVVLVLEGQSDGGNFFPGALGEIGDRAVLDLSIFPEGLAQEAAGIGFALDGDFAFVEIH